MHEYKNSGSSKVGRYGKTTSTEITSKIQKGNLKEYGGNIFYPLGKFKSLRLLLSVRLMGQFWVQFNIFSNSLDPWQHYKRLY